MGYLLYVVAATEAVFPFLFLIYIFQNGGRSILKPIVIILISNIILYTGIIFSIGMSLSAALSRLFNFSPFS